MFIIGSDGIERNTGGSYTPDYSDPERPKRIALMKAWMRAWRELPEEVKATWGEKAAKEKAALEAMTPEEMVEAMMGGTKTLTTKGADRCPGKELGSR